MLEASSLRVGVSPPPPRLAVPIEGEGKGGAPSPLAGEGWGGGWIPGAALVVILVAAASLRFVGLNWDDGHHLHPDERFITMVADRIRVPSSPGEYFDTARSPLNPYNKDFGSYIYGTFPLFFVRALAELIQAAASGLIPAPAGGDLGAHLRAMTGYGSINLLGRALSGAADLLTIVLIFLVGRRLYGQAVGLVAALLASFTVLQIQAAHFFTAESPLVLLTTLAFYFAVRVAQTGSLRDWAFLGVATGLAAATKLNALMLGAVALGAAWVFWQRWRAEPTPEPTPSPQPLAVPRGRGGGGRLEELVAGLVLSAFFVAVTFRIAQPYAFAGPGPLDMAFNPKWLADVDTWQRFASGEADYPPSHQWTGATPFVWQLTNMTLWGMGPPIALAAYLGALLAAVALIREPRARALQVLPLLWVGVNFIYWGVQFAKPMRYLLPIYPQLALLAAFALVSAWRWAKATDRRQQAIGEATLTSPAPQGGRAVAPPVPSPLTGEGEGGGGPRPTFSRRMPHALRAAVVVVIGWTAIYAVAFASIYTRPTTRVAASEWIYQHVPAGSGVGWEHWDDPLPLRLPGRDSSIYRGVELPMYAEDNAEKRAQLIAKLDEADYIVLSSNRLYGSIPKLPLRYPMTTRYYQALFGGELGFENAAEFTSRPSLLGIELNDDDAEEIFTVYEHPKVTILNKSLSYSSAQVRRVLESVDLDQAVRGLKPIHASTGGLLLRPAEAEAARAGGTWSAMFDRDSLANQTAPLAWYLAVQGLALLALPLAWLIFRRLADGGYAFAKTIGVLAVAYVPWLLGSAHLVPYTQGSITLGVVALGLIYGVVLWRDGRAFLAQLATIRTPIIATEALFAAAFLGFLAIRAANPDLWHSVYGGEKPMDYAYLNAVIKTTWFPPYDPWFAGGYINYYYFGQVIVASLTKLTGIVPWVAYNLAVPTIAALTAINAASVAYNLLARKARVPRARQWWALGGAGAAAFLAVGAGNLHGFVQIIEWLAKADGLPVQSLIPGLGGAISAVRGLWIWTSSGSQGLPPFSFDFWAPTRVITTEPVAPITEFPYFTFLYGDLHAHMIAMPLGLLALGLALNVVLGSGVSGLGSGFWGMASRVWHLGSRASGRLETRDAGRDTGEQLSAILTLVAAALVIGVLRMTNTWDFPTYLALIGAAIFLAEAIRPRRDWPTVLARTIVLGLGVAALSHLLIAPYLQSYAQFYTGVERAPFHTTAPHYLVIMGAFLAVLVAYLTFQLSAVRGRLAIGALGAWAAVSGGSPAQSITTTRPLAAQPALDRLAGAFGLGVAFLAVLLLMAGLPVVGIAGAGVGALGVVAVLRRPPPFTLFVFLLAATALGITAFVEIVTLKGDIGRMNTVFKFYVQAWLLLSIACSVLLALMARRAWSSRWLLVGWRRVLALSLAAVLAMTLIYPLLGTPSKLQHRFQVDLPLTLDGMAYMSQARYEDNGRDLRLPDDFAAINWMLDNIQGTPVVIEGLAPLYHWRSRVSIYTGLPTVLGWDWHQKQQRGDFAYMVDERARDVEAIYSTRAPEAARALLDKYRVEYIYVGGQERAFYQPEGLEKFERMVGAGLERVYHNPTVTIYRVMRA